MVIDPQTRGANEKATALLRHFRIIFLTGMAKPLSSCRQFNKDTGLAKPNLVPLYWTRGIKRSDRQFRDPAGYTHFPGGLKAARDQY